MAPHRIALLLGIVAGGAAAVSAQTGGFGFVVPAAELPAVERTIFAAPWAEKRALPATCPVIHVLLSSVCPYCKGFVRENMAALDREGYVLRVHTVPSTSDTMDRLAEVAQRRDFALAMRLQDRQPFAAPDARRAPDDRIDAFNAMLASSNSFRDFARRRGVAGYTPGFLWQDRAGKWRMNFGYSTAMMPKWRATLAQPGPECRR